MTLVLKRLQPFYLDCSELEFEQGRKINEY